MGYYSEYLDAGLGVQEIADERKSQLKQISELRGGRDVFVYAADIDKKETPPAWLSINYSDLLPFQDQLSNLRGSKIDLILETGGGSGEVAEDLVCLLHERYEEVGVIIPGWAKSAGTIIAMAGDEILMEPTSALGPIDAQMSWQGKVFSADALIEGMEKIKREVELTGNLNKAYIPMLQGISPGELQSAQNQLEFARILVSRWLAQYKFKNWIQHSNGQPVTPDERTRRADEIAGKLCNHKEWLTHGRSIRIADLKDMRLRITDYSEIPDLAEAIRRYHTLLQMMFDTTNIYKIFETPESQIVRFVNPSVATPQNAESVLFDATCPKCKTMSKIQANFAKKPLQKGYTPFPKDDVFTCPNCSAKINLSDARRQIEVQSKRSVVDEFE